MDRNYQQAQLVNGVQKSLSARRAWIEMIGRQRTIRASAVALRKESVDRNVHTLLETVIAGVALRKESVDRNTSADSCGFHTICRSPQGERG